MPETIEAPLMPTVSERVQKIISRHNALKREKQPWLTTYQLVGEYIFMRRQDFTHTLAPGQFLNNWVFDATAPRVLHQMASSLIGALFPGGDKVFQFKPPDTMPDEDKRSKEVQEYYRWASQVAMKAMMNSRAGLILALEEYMLDQGAFGISGIFVEENEDDDNMPIRFRAIDTKRLTIDEDKNGFVDTVYIETEMFARQVVQEYGLDNVSPKVREMYTSGDLQKKVKVLHAIEPRLDRTVWNFGNANMPVASIHLEIENNHILRESGFHEMPVFVTRFYKAMSERYGRSPGMEAMPDVLEINAMRESMIMATEKMLNPPLAITQDGAAGGGTINTSAGKINIRTINGRISDSAYKWIEPIMTVGDIKPCKERIAEIQEIIGNHFFMDRLMDLNNEQRMTLGEANIREKLRGQTLGTVYARQIAELFTPMIQRVFNILLGRGLLGVPENSPAAVHTRLMGREPKTIPDQVLRCMIAGDNCYDVEYLTPAARIMRSEELMGIQQTASMLSEMAKSGNMSVFDNIDMDKMVEHIVELTGAPSDIVMDGPTMKTIRTARQAAQQQAAAIEQGHIKAQTARGYGQAVEAGSKAGVAPEVIAASGEPQQQQSGVQTTVTGVSSG